MRYSLRPGIVALAFFVGLASLRSAAAQTPACIRLPAPVGVSSRAQFSSVADIIGRDSNMAASGQPAIATVSSAQANEPQLPELIDTPPVELGPRGDRARGHDHAQALPAMCDACPNYVFNGFVSYDSFKGVADGGWQNNGVVAGFNLGTRLGVLSDLTGIGFQIGASIGVFDWSGADYRPFTPDSAQTQGFFTFGMFRRAVEGSRWTGAYVQDTMYNNNFGIFGQNPMLIQMRGQLGYCTSAWNEFGIWGTMRGFGQTLIVPTIGPVRWQPVQQLNVYWHHKWFMGGPDTWFWVGRPEQSRITRDGSLGDYLAGAAATAPLSDRVSIFALATYMHPSAAPGPDASIDEAWNFTIGLAFYPKPNARSTTVAGRCWAPLLPVANNGYFLTDTNFSKFGPT
ncbi:MAG TPA: DUF6666 family protein [Pirellulales bacterium]|nr:DUF6666 family protein [Pirellulales bacterium]